MLRGVGHLSDCKIGLHLIDPVFDNEVRAALEAFDLALHTPSGTALGRLEGYTIDQELVFALEVDLIVAFLLIGIVVRVAWRSARRLSCTALASGRGRIGRGRYCARGFRWVGEGSWLSRIRGRLESWRRRAVNRDLRRRV